MPTVSPWTKKRQSISSGLLKCTRLANTPSLKSERLSIPWAWLARKAKCFPSQIIRKKLFDLCQEVMANKSKPKSPKLKPYVYRGFFRCGECGCFITTETQKGHNYLRCTKRKNPCSQKYAREDAITSQIREEIKKVSLSSAWANTSINYF